MRRESCSVVSESVLSSVASLLLVAIRGVEAMSKASILKVGFGALKLTISSNNARVVEL